jgi:hypothetical protein
LNSDFAIALAMNLIAVFSVGIALITQPKTTLYAEMMALCLNKDHRFIM